MTARAPRHQFFVPARRRAPAPQRPEAAHGLLETPDMSIRVSGALLLLLAIGAPAATPGCGNGGSTNDAGGGSGGSAGASGSGGSGGSPVASCPAAAPASGASCSGAASCFYEECAAGGRTVARCASGAWRVETGPCTGAFCQSQTCAPGQVCLMLAGGALLVECVQNTCADGAISCGCLQTCAGTCTIGGSLESGVTIQCNTCPSNQCA